MQRCYPRRRLRHSVTTELTKERKPSTADNATDIGATRRHAPGATAAPQKRDRDHHTAARATPHISRLRDNAQTMTNAPATLPRISVRAIVPEMTNIIRLQIMGTVRETTVRETDYVRVTRIALHRVTTIALHRGSAIDPHMAPHTGLRHYVLPTDRTGL